VDDGVALSRHCLRSYSESEKEAVASFFRREIAFIWSLLLVLEFAFIDAGECAIHPTPQ
jgi:hypothetical protein